MTINNHILSKTNNDVSNDNCNVFVDELMTIYNSEKRLNLSLPKMILNAKSPEIVKALTIHLKFTQEHLLRLEELFTSINQPLEP
jgi:ferritin-like metal-binding protein YciE